MTNNNLKSEDILKKIFQLQTDYTSLLKLDRYPEKQDERISVLCTAIIHETIELQRLTSWKWWKIPSSLDLDLAKEELIDIKQFRELFWFFGFCYGCCCRSCCCFHCCCCRC